MPEKIKPKESANEVMLVMYGLGKVEYSMGFSTKDLSYLCEIFFKICVKLELGQVA